MEGFFSEKEINFESRKAQKMLIKNSKSNFPKGDEACKQCKLFKQPELHHPKLKPYGKFEKKILVIGETPAEYDDIKGKPFYPKSATGGLLHRTFKTVGLNLYKDCKIINACDCRSFNKNGSSKTPTDKEIRCCLYRTELAIKKFKPKYILLLGDKAKKSFYSYDSQRKKYGSIPMESFRGQCVPDKNSQAYVYHSYHPKFITHGNKDMEAIFKLDILNFARAVNKNKKIKFHDFTKNSKVLIDFKSVKALLQKIKRRKKSFTFDYETSSYRYYEGIHEVYLVSIHIRGDKTTYTLPLDFPRGNRNSWWKKKDRKIIFKLFKNILEDPNIGKIAQNTKHEIHCSYYLLGAKVKNIVHDTMLSTHIINSAKLITGLKKQAFIQYGQYDYGISDNIISAEPQKQNLFKTLPFKVATEYCSIDSKITDKLITPQVNIMKRKKLMKANKLFLEGAQAFSEIEHNGIKINTKLAEKLGNVWGEQIENIKDKILSSKEAQRFKKITGRNLKYEKKLSDDDLRVYLFDILKLNPLKKGKVKNSVDYETLVFYSDKSELIKNEMECRRLDKMKNTYLAQWLRLQVNGFLYPTFNLHTARSFRSSASNPSFQNIPKRSEGANELRQLFCSRFGNSGILAEVDYGSMEVRIIACVTHDQALIDYIVHGGDMHGDWAEIIFNFRKNEVPKKAFKALRYITKNHWVFPLFYGSWHKSIARNTDVFKIFKELDLQCPFNSQKEWEEHLENCESKFWKQFKGVRVWQKKYVDQYKRTGFIRDFAWGFVADGYLTRNQIYNFPIQGPAYHCLQWTINTLWKNNFYNYESLLCGQIHDALFWDCKKDEFNTVRKKVHYLMTEKIREVHPWIIVPLIDEWSKGATWDNMYDVNWERIKINV